MRDEIDLERLHLRVQVAALFPEKMPLYDMVYESRFRGEAPEIDGNECCDSI